MQIKFNINKQSFGYSKQYKNGLVAGKIDGYNGKSDYKINPHYTETEQKDYETGYNVGYQKGQKSRKGNTVTTSDVIQDLVNSGTPRDQAIQFVASAFGGW